MKHPNIHVVLISRYGNNDLPDEARACVYEDAANILQRYFTGLGYKSEVVVYGEIAPPPKRDATDPTFIARAVADTWAALDGDQRNAVRALIGEEVGGLIDSLDRLAALTLHAGRKS